MRPHDLANANSPFPGVLSLYYCDASILYFICEVLALGSECSLMRFYSRSAIRNAKAAKLNLLLKRVAGALLFPRI